MDFRPASSTFDAEAQTLHVAGSIDELAVDDLRLAIYAATDHYTRDLTIDLSDVNFLPSMAIGVLASAMRQAAAK